MFLAVDVLAVAYGDDLNESVAVVDSVEDTVRPDSNAALTGPAQFLGSPGSWLELKADKG